MLISDEILKELAWAQEVCGTINDQSAVIERAVSVAAELQGRVKALESFYQNRWLEICEDPGLTDEDRDSLIFRARPGSYSVLGEDTIWDALQAARRVQIACSSNLPKLFSRP